MEDVKNEIDIEIASTEVSEMADLCREPYPTIIVD